MAQLTPHKDLLHRSYSVRLRAAEGRRESNWHMDITIAVIKIICDCSTLPDVKQNIVNDEETRPNHEILNKNNIFNFIEDLYKTQNYLFHKLAFVLFQ